MPAKRHTQVAAVLALLVAVGGGGYAARSLVHSDAASTGGVTGAAVIACPPNAHGWKGRVTGARPAATAAKVEVATAAAINTFREAHHRYPLHANAALTAAARAHSLNMVQRHYFSHDGPGGAFAARLARYTPQTCIAENIAAGPVTAAAIVAAWKASPPHRQIMLLPWVTQIGIGIRGHVVTADFSG